ncbi:MAG: hypothetical protein U0354_16565 [Candidatus Sericytochromatia bacterium]
MSSSILYSCNSPIENINKNNDSKELSNNIAFISVSDKKGASIKVNINSIVKSFSTKATQNGSQEITNMNSIRIVLSENSLDPFNFPVNANTSKFYTSPSIPTTVVFDSLQANKTYYIAARAYSSATESTANNITEGGTYITNEYIQVSASGTVSIVGDSAPIGEINFSIPLKNAVGARVDVPVNISNGKMGDFKNKDNKVEQVSTIPLFTPDVDITDGGDGAIVWKERGAGSGIKKIKLKAIIDNIPNGTSLDVDITAPTTDNFNKPTISLNSNNNGFVCWDYTAAASVPIIRFKHLNNLTTLSTLNNLSGSDQSGCDIKIKHTSSDSGILAFTDINVSGVIKARALKSSNNFASFTFGTDISPSDIVISSNASNSNVSLSKVTKDNYVMAIWQRSSGVSRQINSNKIQIDNTGANPNLIVITGNEANLDNNNSSINLTTPSIAIDENGNGFAVWQRGTGGNIICSKIVNFNPEGSLINITTTNNASNPKVYINDQGHGLITWTQAQDIYGLSIVNYELGSTSFKINDLTGSDIQNNSSFDFDTYGNGYVAWEDDRDSPATSEIYGKRIIDYYPN